MNLLFAGGFCLILACIFIWLPVQFEYDLPDWAIHTLFALVWVAGIACVVFLFLFLSRLSTSSFDQRVQSCVDAFHYTKAQCEYFAKYGGPYVDNGGR